MNAPPTELIKQHLIDPEICIRCNTCEATCPVGAITHDDRNYVVDAQKCNLCMDCIAPCPTGSIDNWRTLPRVRAYSVVEQLGWDELPGELGDLLFQAVYHAQMADEAGLFDFDTVVAAISDKMILRHPHVFGDQSRDKTAQQQTADWERAKASERGSARVLDGVALGLPGLTRAVKLQKRAARVGFDWPSTDEVLDKLIEETHELTEARETLTKAEVEEEFGDLLFVMANLARHWEVDPEAALRAANAKFERRFRRIEDWLAEDGRHPSDSTLAEMDALWNRAKAEDKAAKK